MVHRQDDVRPGEGLAERPVERPVEGSMLSRSDTWAIQKGKKGRNDNEARRQENSDVMVGTARP